MCFCRVLERVAYIFVWSLLMAVSCNESGRRYSLFPSLISLLAARRSVEGRIRLEKFFDAITTNPFGRELLGRSLGGLVIAFGLRPRLIVCESGSLFRALGGSLVSLYLYLKLCYSPWGYGRVLRMRGKVVFLEKKIRHRLTLSYFE